MSTSIVREVFALAFGPMDTDRRAHDPAVDNERLPRDSVDALLRSWRARRPELDFEPVAVIARLNRLRSHIDPALAEVFAAHGLSSANFGVLVTLARIGDDGRVSQRRLMDELGLTSGTISVRVDRLVDEGLVVRQTDPESKRNTLITLTERGRELVQRVIPAHLANERRLVAALTDDEQHALESLLRKLLLEFEGSHPPSGAPLRLGVALAPAHVAIAMRKSVGLPPVPALLVRAVDEDGPAGAAGLRTGDVLLRGGTRELRSIGALYAAMADTGDSCRLRIVLLRGMKEHRVTVRLGHVRAPHDTVAATAGRTARGEHTV